MPAQSPEMATENTSNSSQPRDSSIERLTELVAKATALSAVKDYASAAEVYSQAAELQDALNGEMNIENADLLYAYGRCLFFVAQKTSTVLGGTATQAQLSRDSGNRKVKKRKLEATDEVKELKAEPDQSLRTVNVADTEKPADVIPQPEKTADSLEASHMEKQPLFQFTGDGLVSDSSDEEEEAEEEEEEQDDDFETSFEMLDLARILYLRKLARQGQDQTDTGEENVKDLHPAVRDLKLRIADIYDLQSEISLEGEKFSAAVTDLKSCLDFRTELEQPESSLLAECHYKLSLALEAAAQEQQRDPEGNPVGDVIINWDIRNEAIDHQEQAIKCCELRIDKEKAAIAALSDEKSRIKSQEQIEDVQGMVAEMQDRLADLRKPPVSVKAETEKDLSKEMMAGVFGQIMGSAAGKSKQQQQEELAKVIAGATDLSGMIKKKSKRNDPTGDETASNASDTGSKRKAETLGDSIDASREKKSKTKVVHSEQKRSMQD